MALKNVRASLKDLLGAPYCRALVQANAAVGLLTEKEAARLAEEPVSFYPEEQRSRNLTLLSRVGDQVCPAFENRNAGAGTDAFMKAAHPHCAPLTGAGCFRVGEDGRLYFLGKSEHYHASLGHAFGGYRLIDQARALHILNATHNNTRGYITRLMERAVVAAANGISEQDPGLESILASKEPHVLNRVINLETGSVAAEAGVKLMLARFFKLDGSYPEPKYSGRIPVFLVMADDHGGPEGNYHGTSVLTQTMRGLWPEYTEKLAQAGLYRVLPVLPNDPEDFRSKLEEACRPPYQAAGFIHEIVMMNYGGVRLTESFLQEAYRLCQARDVPTMCDEIQSCMWYPGHLLFRMYGLNPDIVILGKGFPGGEYPASRMLTTAPMDILNQFGALVTNGQEELASLAYLITMKFADENAENIRAVGQRFEIGLLKAAEKHKGYVAKAEGRGHLGALHFHSVEAAAQFAAAMNDACIDTSAQLYKAHCPPAVLFKPPLLSEEEHIDFLLETIDRTLTRLGG